MLHTHNKRKFDWSTDRVTLTQQEDKRSEDRIQNGLDSVLESSLLIECDSVWVFCGGNREKAIGWWMCAIRSRKGSYFLCCCCGLWENCARETGLISWPIENGFQCETIYVTCFG